MKQLFSGADKIMLSIIGGFTVLTIGVIVVLSAMQGKQASAGTNTASYNITDNERPKVDAPSTFSDLGTMKVKDEKKAEFAIENKGNNPLVLSNISSSCGCTVGQITIDGTTSPEFGMHSKGTWQGTVEPGKIATLTVIYRPYIMPVSGVVTRDVYVSTNDPENQKLTFSVRANVE